jgi:hypothetical protein
MQISKKIPFDDPNVLNGVRALYIVSNIIIAAIYFYVQMQINKKNGASTAYRSCDIAGLYVLPQSHADISQT